MMQLIYGIWEACITIGLFFMPFYIVCALRILWAVRKDARYMTNRRIEYGKLNPAHGDTYCNLVWILVSTIMIIQYPYVAMVDGPLLALESMSKDFLNQLARYDGKD